MDPKSPDELHSRIPHRQRLSLPVSCSDPEQDLVQYADAARSDQIRENVLVKQYSCEIDIAHLISYDEELASRLNKEPAEIIPLVCACHIKHAQPPF